MKMFKEKIAENILKIMNDRKMTQAAIAELMGTSPSQLSRELKGEIGISLVQIENLATALSMREIDIITYPDVYELKKKEGEGPVKAILQIELKEEKRDEVLNLVFGKKGVELLNK